MPVGKIAKYNPSADVVAGRTAYQIESAKRKAVGGKRKRCTKGKSCSATCIAASKVCLVEIPWVAAKGIPKVVKAIQQQTKIAPVKELKLTAKEQEMAKDFYKQEWTAAWKKMNLAINDGNKQSYNLHKDKITKYYNQLKGKGADLGPLKIPQWKDKSAPIVIESRKPKTEPKVSPDNTKPAAKGKAKKGFNLAKGAAPSLPPLKTPRDFSDALIYSAKAGEKAHQNIKEILNGTDQANVFARNFLIGAVGGQAAFNKGLDALKAFTGSNYGEIRQAQKNAAAGDTLSSYYAGKLKQAKALEKLLAQLPKETVVKYRGISLSPFDLDLMIKAANRKESFKENALASWSTNLNTSQTFANSNITYQRTERVLFRTVNRRGAAIRAISAIGYEDEVLTSGTAKYKHTGNYNKVVNDGAVYHIFDLVES